MRVTNLLACCVLFVANLPAFSQSDVFQPGTDVGPGTVLVHSKFGGQIFGFDIDQNGTEGVLSESQTLSNGKILAAVETFDQKTGNILKVIAETQTQDDFITMGVVGASVGLIEYEHEISFLNVQRTFHTINPLTANAFTGIWKPPIDTKHLIEPTGVSRNQGTNVAVFAFDNSGNFIPDVFESNVGKNQFGPVVKITDSFNFGSGFPPMAFDPTTHQAVIGGGDGCFDCLPVIGVVDTLNNSFTEFTGIGFGFVNGIAIDAADGLACTTTEDDATVEFYDLKDLSPAFTTVLPGSDGLQIFSGADVEFDSVNKVFLVAQPVSSSASTGSTIYVYDTKGNLEETLNGFSFSNAFNVVPMHIALNPSHRSGFVDGPDAGVTDIQSFTY